MGSQSDWATLKESQKVLKFFGITSSAHILSAHRTPEDLVSFASTAREKGLALIIAGAGGAAHLPGMLAALTTVPVIGVPVVSKSLDGLDSLLSIVQMPKGVPVATVAIGGAHNAALLAVGILASASESPDSARLQKRLDQYRLTMKLGVRQSRRKLR
jgi:5-(carboxyamino)imidazole ribonucleotide mutase